MSTTLPGTQPTADDAAPAVTGPPEVPRARALVAVFAGIGFLFGALPVGDNSFLIHITTGDLIRERGFPHTDPYSFTATGVRWIPQSWLMSLAYSYLDSAAGLVAVRIFIGVLCSITAAVVFLIALRCARDPLRAAALTCGALAVSIFHWNERPLMMGATCFALLVLLVEAPGRRLSARHAPWLLVPLFWVWGNSHGSWILGAGYVALRFIGTALEERALPIGRLRTIAFATVVGCVAIAISPYGLAMLLFPLKLGPSEVLTRVIEWQSPNFRSPERWPFLAWAGVVLFLLGRNRNRTWGDVLVASVFLFLSFWATRNILLVPIVTIPIAARALRIADDRTPSFAVAPALDRVTAAVVAVVMAMLVSASLLGPSLNTDKYPVRTLQRLDREGLVGKRLVTTDVFAGYVIYKYWPRQKVFFDDRFDMYPSAQADDYFELHDGGPKWRAVLDRIDAEVVIWPTEMPLTQLLAEDDGWRREPSGEKGVALFVRK